VLLNKVWGVLYVVWVCYIKQRGFKKRGDVFFSEGYQREFWVLCRVWWYYINRTGLIYLYIQLGIL